MNNLLFIIPWYSLGGTTTALTSILNSRFAEEFDIDVFVIRGGKHNKQSAISQDIGLNELTTAYYGDFAQFHFTEKVKYLIFKLFKQNDSLSAKLENWLTSRTIRKIEYRKKYDVVIGFQEGLATRFASHFTCPHKVAWIHCDYANAFGEEKDEMDLYKHFDKVVCVSQFTRQRFINRYPNLTEKTVAIHNIFDAEHIVELSKAAIKDPRFDTSCFTIISLGRVDKVKRFYLIPEIAVQMKKADIDFRWYILGNANIPSELKHLNDAIRRNDMENNVLFLGGKSNPYPYLRAADLLVTTSKSEACPMIFNEAKILHVPILSADFGSAYEFIEEGKDGYIIPIELFAQKLIELANQHETLVSIKNTKNITEANERIAKQLFRLFTNEQGRNIDRS